MIGEGRVLGTEARAARAVDEMIAAGETTVRRSAARVRVGRAEANTDHGSRAENFGGHARRAVTAGREIAANHGIAVRLRLHHRS
jgi:hypothetical protein